MKSTLLGLAVVTALLFSGAALAGSGSKAIDDSDTDASPDSIDIVAAKAHRAKDKLTHTIRTDGPLDDGPNTQILLQINTGGNLKCELELIWPRSGKSKLIHCGVGETGKAGTISQPRPNTLEFGFSKGAIGSPARYGWRVISRECAGCPTLDSAPDQDGGKPVYVTQKLR